MTQEEQHRINDIVDAMSGIRGPKCSLIINLQLCRFFCADTGLGMHMPQGLGIGATQHPGSKQLN